jgi:hypothetical protein
MSAALATTIVGAIVGGLIGIIGVIGGAVAQLILQEWIAGRGRLIVSLPNLRVEDYRFQATVSFFNNSGRNAAVLAMRIKFMEGKELKLEAKPQITRAEPFPIGEERILFVPGALTLPAHEAVTCDLEVFWSAGGPHGFPLNSVRSELLAYLSDGRVLRRTMFDPAENGGQVAQDIGRPWYRRIFGG